jgi:hypothetical protein
LKVACRLDVFSLERPSNRINDLVIRDDVVIVFVGADITDHPPVFQPQRATVPERLPLIAILMIPVDYALLGIW